MRESERALLHLGNEAKQRNEVVTEQPSRIDTLSAAIEELRRKLRDGTKATTTFG